MVLSLQSESSNQAIRGVFLMVTAIFQMSKVLEKYECCDQRRKALSVARFSYN